MNSITQSPCQTNSNCQYCCIEGQCRDEAGCEPAFMSSFAFVVFIVLIVICCVIFITWCYIKRRSNKNLYNSGAQYGGDFIKKFDNEDRDQVQVKEFRTVIEMEADQNRYGRVAQRI